MIYDIEIVLKCSNKNRSVFILVNAFKNALSCSQFGLILHR